MPSITLNMIVKDEEKTIKRCLDSVVDIIDFFVIMDTGSKDNTVDIIKKYFSEKNKKGIIKKSHFHNFSQARNESLLTTYKFSPKTSGKDYILLLDSDMILHIDKFSKNDLFLDAYYIVQKTNKLEYKNIRLIKNNGIFFYKGYTHEVLISSTETRKGNIKKNCVYIEDIGDGGSKKDKCERDIRLLKKEILDEPKFSRPYFYLANTFFGKKEYESSEEYYKKRIVFGGWKEEIWYSYYRLGIIKALQGNIPESIYFFFSSIETHPRRLESYYHLLLILKENKMGIIYDMVRRKSKDIYENKFDTMDYLFYEKNICENEIQKMIFLDK
jgi:glycosyltransferase involved in cell wall biosynthesis